MNGWPRLRRLEPLDVRNGGILGVVLLLTVLVVFLFQSRSRQDRLQHTTLALRAELEQVQDELAAMRAGDEHRAADSVRQDEQLRSLTREVSSFAARVGAIDEVERQRRLEIQLAESAAAQALALGISWQETSGKQNWRLFGTGFQVGDGTIGVTAGHVIQELVRMESDLTRRGLAPQRLAVTPDGKTASWNDYALHSSLTTTGNEIAVDLGALRFENGFSAETRPRLKWASQDASPGTVVVTAGYPVEVSGIVYGHPSQASPQPTVKFGRIERAGTPLQLLQGTRVTASAETLQHSLTVGGGFSGAPLLDADGEAIGVITWSSHVLLSPNQPHRAGLMGTVRLLDAAGGHFALPASIVRPWIDELTSPSSGPAWTTHPSNE